MSQGERLMRIETLLETKLDGLAAGQAAINQRLGKIEEHQTKQDTDSALDRADLAALKNKGAGILIGVGLAGGAVGATIATWIETATGIFK